MFRVSCLGIWWRHDIWISENLKFDYLKNEKSFRSEIKTFLLVSQVLSFRHKKQTSKNVADTTFNIEKSSGIIDIFGKRKISFLNTWTVDGICTCFNYFVIFHHPLFNLFFKCSLYQNKALYNFHKRGQLLTAGHIKGLD